MRGDSGRLQRVAGYAVHIFTSLGAVCALLALLAMLDHRFEAGFAWLFAALVIDAVDGTIARAVKVEATLPRFSVERLDLVIDFVTYVFVPVVALLKAGFLVGYPGLAVAALILLSSLFHFADTDSKSDDNCFVGFPAVWNLVAFCFFAWGFPSWAATAVAIVLCLLPFVPMHWIHPMRVRRLFAVNVAAALLGLVGAIWVLWSGFPATPVPAAMLALSAAYFVLLAFAWRSGDGGGVGKPRLPT